MKSSIFIDLEDGSPPISAPLPETYSDYVSLMTGLWPISEPDCFADDIPIHEPDPVECPFTIAVDNREKLPYQFQNIRCNKVEKNALMIVRTCSTKLDIGDYSIVGLPGVAIERKSKADLYGSVARRENFKGRLRRMEEGMRFAAVVVECEESELWTPPDFTRMEPRAILQTVHAWRVQYPRVHWIFYRNRHTCENRTFRLLQFFYIEAQRRGLIAGMGRAKPAPLGGRDRPRGEPSHDPR